MIIAGGMSHEKVIEEMSQSICYVMTSFSEAFPFVLLEAMSQGLPVVAYDVRVGPAAIIQNGESGFLVSEGNEKEFIEKLKNLCEDSELLKTMSEKAVQRSQEFSEENVMKQWMEILEGSNL